MTSNDFSAEPRKLNPIYSCLVPLTLLVVAGLVHTFTNEEMFAAAAAVLALVGLGTFADALFGTVSIGVFKIIGLSYCLGFGLSSFNTWYGTHLIPEPLALYTQYSDRILCHGLAFVCFSVAVFFFLGEVLERHIVIDPRALARSVEINWFIWGAFALVIAAFLHGSLGYMGFSTNDGKVDVLGAAGYWVISPLFALALTKAIHSETPGKRLLHWLLFATVALMLLPLGRRVLIYTIFVAGLFLRFDPTVSSLKGRTKVMIVALTLVLLSVGTFGFLYLRFATYELGDQTHYSLAALTSEAVVVFRKRSYAEVATVMQENAESRGFVLGYSAAVLEFSETQQISGGEGLGDAIFLVIPSALNPGKLSHLPEQEEYLVDRLYHTDYADEANTLLSAGAVDFGSFGALVYPLGIAGLTIFMLNQARRLLTPVFSVVVVLASFYALLNLETTVTSYLVLLRDTTLYAVVFSVAYRLRPRRLR